VFRGPSAPSLCFGAPPPKQDGPRFVFRGVPRFVFSGPLPRNRMAQGPNGMPQGKVLSGRSGDTFVFRSGPSATRLCFGAVMSQGWSRAGPPTRLCFRHPKQGARGETHPRARACLGRLSTFAFRAACSPTETENGSCRDWKWKYLRTVAMPFSRLTGRRFEAWGFVLGCPSPTRWPSFLIPGNCFDRASPSFGVHAHRSPLTAHEAPRMRGHDGVRSRAPPSSRLLRLPSPTSRDTDPSPRAGNGS
jgi:hypothetical protein